MKIRITGTEEECRTAAAAISRVLDVLETSEPYPNRGDSKLARLYLEARIRANTPKD